MDSRTPKFNIGDSAWYPSFAMTQKAIVCPDCAGQKFLTVILGDESRVTIDCTCCEASHSPMAGFVWYNEHGPQVQPIIVTRVEINNRKIEYGFAGCYRATEDELFKDREAAEIQARELAKEWNNEQVKKITRKEKDHRTWSWHVVYHRQCIKRAQRELEYHTAKLDAAKLKAKE